MKILASRIAKELKKAKRLAAIRTGLARVSPDDGRQREPQIASFHKTHGWRLRYYKDGFCAIFDKDPPRFKRNRAEIVETAVSYSSARTTNRVPSRRCTSAMQSRIGCSVSCDAKIHSYAVKE